MVVKVKERGSPLSARTLSSPTRERSLVTINKLLTRDCSLVCCRWLPRGKEEPHLQVASKREALGRSKRRRRRKKTKLFDVLLSTITAAQESPLFYNIKII